MRNEEEGDLFECDITDRSNVIDSWQNDCLMFGGYGTLREMANNLFGEAKPTTGRLSARSHMFCYKRKDFVSSMMLKPETLMNALQDW